MNLFGEPDPPAAPKLSIEQRRTVRRREMIEAGTNPASKQPLANNDETCGTCVHHASHHRTKTYHKCRKAPGGMTAGPATDVRVGWPACVLWEPEANADD